MATCRFPGCGYFDPASALPRGWALVSIERRGGDPATLFDPATLSIDRSRFVLCPVHAPLVEALQVRPVAGGGADERRQSTDPRRDPLRALRDPA